VAGALDYSQTEIEVCTILCADFVAELPFARQSACILGWSKKDDTHEFQA